MAESRMGGSRGEPANTHRWVGFGRMCVEEQRAIGGGKRLGQLGGELMHAQDLHVRPLPVGHGRRSPAAERVVSSEIIAISDHQPAHVAPACFSPG